MAGAATAQGVANTQTAEAQARLNNPSVQTPFFNRDVTFNPDDTSNVNVSFTPGAQSAFEGATRALGTPLDLSGVTPLASTGDINNAIGKVSDAMYQRQTAMLDPQWKQNQIDENTTLANQGFAVGSEGYTKAQESLQRSKEMAYGQARDSSINQGEAAAANEANIARANQQQQIANILAGRQQPLNELNALLSGSQVGAGSTSPTSIQPTPIMQGAEAQNQANQQTFGTQAGMFNSTLGGLFGLGGTAALATML